MNTGVYRIFPSSIQAPVQVRSTGHYHISPGWHDRLEQKSILELDYPKNYFKVSFSSGVLEHFSDEEIVLTLKQQLFISEFVIVSIPTDYFEDSEAMHGDERFMSIKKWRELITRANGTILREANCHYLNFPYHYVIPKKWFKPWPYRIFLIKS